MTGRETSRNSGVLWVAAGAALWGTDTVLRQPLAQQIGPVHIVLYEHLILSLIALPILYRHRRALIGIRPGVWAAILAIAWGASALATVLFTLAIRSGNPTTAVLLQKLQPVFAIFLARYFLGERWPSSFPVVIGGAIVGGYLISFGGGSLLDPLSSVDAAPAALAAGAALIWGAATVLGRWISAAVPFDLLVGLRILCAVPFLTALSLMESPVLPDRSQVSALVLLALVPGFAALMLYYKGLRRTPAFSATVAELAFPATAALLNWTILGAEGRPIQVVGFAIVWMSIALVRRQTASEPSNSHAS